MHTWQNFPHIKIMFNVILRVAIILIIVLIFLRLMGKRQLGEMQPIELVITFIIAEVACVPMSDHGIPILYGIIPITTLYLLHFFLSFLSRKSLKFRALIDGHSILVIDKGNIDYKALKMLNMNINDLLETTRSQGYFDLTTIEYAVFETNGTLCIIPKAEHAPVTAGDMKIKTQQTTIPISLIIDGKAINLDLFAITKKKLESLLQKKGAGRIKDIALATVNEAGEVFIQPKQGKHITTNIRELRYTA